MKLSIMKLTPLIIIFIFSINDKLNAQVFSNGGEVAGQYYSNNAFLDATTSFGTAISGSNINGKGLVFPRTDLTAWEFLTADLDEGFIGSSYGGMIVYNTGTGNTPVTGNNPTTSVTVEPGFYYFSNPTISAFDVPSIAAGVWLPIGGQSATVKSKTVPVTVAANPTTATLDLGLAVIGASEVAIFLGAKVYDASGNLVMTADSAYNKVTNELTTGNGMMYQVLPAGDYTVVVDYK
jgi:hypothetical protein